MRRLLFWLVIVPALASVAVFAFNNRSAVSIDLWPFGVSVEMPVYLAFIVTLGAGVVVGGLVSWLGQGRTRARLRERTYQGEVARRELAMEREKTARSERASRTPKVDPLSGSKVSPKLSGQAPFKSAVGSGVSGPQTGAGLQSGRADRSET